MTEIDQGAHYRRTDLQVHTPRDPSWKGKRPVGGSDREQYGRDFVAACRAKSLQAVAITDHHDFVFVDYIREAAATETDETGSPLPEVERLTVFPGLELSLAVPCQALLVLDADFPADRLSSVLEQLRIEVQDPEAKKHTEPKELDFDSLGGLRKHLDKNGWLKGRYALLPNVTDGGLGTLIRKKMQSRYKEMPCVGGYVDGPVEDQGKGITAILTGESKEWGNKRIAVIQTSDSRSADFKSLGIPSTWIKWAEPTAEALRQACLAQESRISHTEPQLPGIVIIELRVSNSQFLGPVGLALNPQYNALIGGREPASRPASSTCAGLSVTSPPSSRTTMTCPITLPAAHA